MRFEFDPAKSKRLRDDPRRGIGFEEIQELFRGEFYEEYRSEIPAQFRAIGWVGGRLFAVIFEVREDLAGEYYHLVTLWPATRDERALYEGNIQESS